ncbi:uncharacterized protein [Watersipora subatra]|uniref:uncharacterized protein n=1 Tax=Watersipora subatra TaxID=2589382 RepID=UPI00355C3E92
MVSRKAPWSHDEQVRAAWKNRKVRWEIKSIITEKYKAYDDYLKSREVYDQTSIKPTVLQLALEEYSVVAPKECKLISKMLSFYHYDRPTFTHIKESINNLIKEKSLAKSSSSGEATSYIPATIASYEASSSRGWVQTTLSTEAKDLLAVGALSTIAPISGMERDSLSYGPPSDYSFQADDMREDYDAALADENFDKEERMKHLKEEMALVIANNERERGELEKARAELERKAEELERKKAEMELTAQIWSLLPSFSLPDDAALARVLQMLTWEGESENIMRQLAIYPDARRRLVQRMLQVFSSQIDDQACSGAIVTNQYHRKRHIIPIVDPDTNAVLNAEVSDQTPASEDKSLQLSQEALCQASGSLLHTNVNNASLHSTLKSSSAADSSGPCLLANHSIHLVPKAKFDSTSNDTTFFATYSSNNEMTAIYPRTAAPSTMSNWEWKTAPSTISACPWGTASSTTSSYTSMPTLSSVSRKKNFGWVNDERHQSSLPLNPTSTRLGNAESVPSVEASATPEKNVSFVTTTLHRSKGKASSTKDFSKTPLMVNPKQLIHKVVKSTLDPRTGAKVNELEPMNDYHNEHLFAEHHHTQVMPKLNLDTEAANKQLAVIHESLDSSLKIDCTANSSKNSLMSPIIHHDTKKDVHKLLYLGRMSDNCFPARNAGNDLFLQTKCTAIVESDATSENLGTHSKQRAPRALDPEAVPFSSTVNILTDVQKRSVETHIHSHKKGCDDSLESLASSHSPTMRWNQKDLPIADTMTQEAVNTLSYTQPDTFDKPSQTVAVGKPLLGTRKKVILSIRDPNTGVVLNAQPMVNSSKRLGSSPSVNLPAMLHTEKKPALVDSDVFTSSLQPASIAENAIPSTRTNSALAIVNPNTGAVINETQLLDDGEKLIQRSASVVCPSLPRRKSKAIPILDPETHEVVDTSSYTCFKNCSKFFTIDGHGVGISIIESKENEQ